jgi:hypothetical protein
LTLIARRVLPFLATVACGVVVTASATGAAQVQQGAITVDDPRPLASAVAELEKRHGWVVTYEDPPYESAGDVRDVTGAVRKDSDLSKTVLVPNGGLFVFNYVLANLAGSPDPQTVLPALLDAYHLSGNPGMFRLLRTESVFHVVPATSQNSRGGVAPRTSRLDVLINIRAQDRSALEMLQAILRAVSESTGTNLVVGTVPTNLLLQTRVRQPVSNTTATTALIRTFAATRKNLSWQLFCQPGTTTCAMNVHVVEGPEG